MSNCTNCSKPNPYQEGPYLCFECKNPPYTAKPVDKDAVENEAGLENPWMLGSVRKSLEPKPPASVLPVCKACSYGLASHRPGQNAVGKFGYFDDPKAWACPKGDKWEDQQWYDPDS